MAFFYSINSIALHAIAMASQIQALLRFLSQDAKVPLASAMGKVKELQKEGLLE